MPAPNAIEESLRSALPSELQPRAAELAQLIAAAAQGQQTTPSPDLMPALKALAGRQLQAGQSLISFDAAQLGDVAIGDVAGGDLVKVSLVVATEAPQVAQGRNIVQIGRLVLPARLILLLVALLAGFVIVSTGVAFATLRGSVTMPGSSFNIAVADLASTASGEPSASDEGRRLGRLVYDALQQQKAIYGENNSGVVVTLWHDSLSWREKGATIGFIPGADDAAREEAARQRLKALGAQVLIYGYLDGEGRATLRFYVSPELKVESGPGVLAGAYQLGEPIPAIAPGNTALTTRAGALFWLLKGLQYDSEGRPARAWDVLSLGEAKLPDWDERGAGKELLFFFKGVAAAYAAASSDELREGETEGAAFTRWLDAAESSFDLALKRPGFARAMVGRGSVHMLRAQCELGASPCPPLSTRADERDAALQRASSEAEGALQQYQAAREAARISGDQLYASGGGDLAIGSAHVLLGGLARLQNDPAAADAEYAQAVALLSSGLPAVGGDRRRLAQTYQMLGTALWQRGDLAQSRPTEAATLLRKASEAFADCLAQGGTGDQLIEERVLPVCQERRTEAEALLKHLTE